MKALPAIAVLAAASSLAPVTLQAGPPTTQGGFLLGRPTQPMVAIGDRVQTTKPTRVWETPPTAGKYLGDQPKSSAGLIVDGPVRSADMWWWKVDFDVLSDGWIAQRDLARSGGNPTASPTPVAAATAPTATISDVWPPSGAVVSGDSVVVRGRVSHDIYSPAQISASINGKTLALDPRGNFAVKVRLTPGSNSFTVLASTANPRQQPTQISAYLDGSMIYGSDATRAKALRSFSGGHLKTSDGNLLPLNTEGLANANDAHIFPDNQLFLAGDIRANENIELTAIHTLFMREHNQLATAIAAANPGLTDEQIFQRARRIVIAEVQNITYREFLPALLGPNALRPYAGYQPDVNAGIATEFSTAAYRIGHTLINDDIEFLDNDGKEVRDGLSLAFAFFNPAPVKETGPDPLLKYLATDNAQEIDPQLVDGLRNFLFGPPGAGGLDLASLNIQRGRDHGLPGYNAARVAYGLPAVTTFAQVTSDPVLNCKLAALYGTPGDMDLWVGGLAEDHLPGSSVGATFQRILAEQFERTRDGDRYWYEFTFGGRQLDAIRATTLADVIRRNTTITKIQDNVFLYDPDATLGGLVAKAGTLPAALFNGPATFLAPASLDGTGNNSQHPNWGAAGADLLRVAPAAYGDGISTPAGATRPGARGISNSVSVLTTPYANDRLLSSWVYGWGQFIDHDLDLTVTGDTAFDIPVPTGDPSFDPNSTGTQTIPFTRSTTDATTGTVNSTSTQKTFRIVSKSPRGR